MIRMNHETNFPQTELPLPEANFRAQGIGSRATFYRWEKLGLRVLHVGGRRFIRPSELAVFLERQSTQKVAAPSSEVLLKHPGLPTSAK